MSLSKARRLADAMITSSVVTGILEAPEEYTVVNTISDSNISSDVLNLVDSSRPRFITMMQTGAITAPFTGVSRAYAPDNIRVSNVKANVGTAPTSDLVFNLLKNGVEVGNYTISASSFRLSSTAANITATDSDYFTVDIASGEGATDLKIDLTYRFI